MHILITAITLLAGLYLLWNMGANDVANAMGTSVGSGAISFKKAILIAATLEFCGAVLLGSKVSHTIGSFINISEIPQRMIIFGMLSAMIATGIWIQLATFCRWPISTTHAIVGGIIGFGSISLGLNKINWPIVGSVTLGWVISPIISAAISFCLFSLIQHKILYAYTPLLVTKRVMPCLVFITLTTFMFSSFGHINLSFIPILALGIIGAILHSWYHLKHYKDIKMKSTILPYMRELHLLKKARKNLIKANLSSGSQKIEDITNQISDLIEKLESESNYINELPSEYTNVEKIFASLQVITACFVAFAHGSNDVSNAIAPISTIFSVMNGNEALPQWLLFFGGGGIVLGLITDGWKVIETIGKSITHLTPSRGFSAEFGAALTILIASRSGLPISTTHAIVGSVVGIGLAGGLPSINSRLVSNIFKSWVITIPISMALTIMTFYIFKFSLMEIL